MEALWHDSHADTSQSVARLWVARSGRLRGGGPAPGVGVREEGDSPTLWAFSLRSGPGPPGGGFVVLLRAVSWARSLKGRAWVLR